MSNTIMITKRDGTQEPLDLEKMHKVTYEAEKGLAGVSASQIEMNANLQFYDGMTTEEIQEILIRSASDLISLENPNYQYAAARLLLYGIYKEVFGQFQPKHFVNVIIQNVKRGVYDKQIIENYTKT
ncbi:MAG: ribonucleotide-diphosphate reductase subunit alpha, partial [Rhodobacteraceae bacterium]|nr:ribonucleotide-diphosphate reductase subunit alpha [Paracoccaceae bacterium]